MKKLERIVEIGSPENDGWLIDYMDDVEDSDFVWSPQYLTDEPASSDLGLHVSEKGENFQENSSSKKRVWAEPCIRMGTKACREKMRRDKLNNRFLELCYILDPEKAPKTNKIILMFDAICVLKQLRLETQKLKEMNKELQGAIKTLKTEKTELKEEKLKLKMEKDRLEQVVKGMNIPFPFVPLPAFHAPSNVLPVNSKSIPSSGNCPPKMAMWQWMTPAFVDTSQDHVLRPPVA